MTHMKTAFSLEESLFRRIEKTAAELQISRSRLLVMALEEFLQRYQTRQLRDAIYAAYADSSDEEEANVAAIKEYLPKVLDSW